MRRISLVQKQFGPHNLLFFATLIMVVGCGGGKFYLNKAFVYEASEATPKLAILPAATGKPAFTDSLFSYIFEDTALDYEIMPPKNIREQIANDPKLLEIFNKLGSIKYSKEDFKSGPLITSDLTTDEFSYLKEALGTPEIILFPVAFNLTSLGVITSGFSRTRLYHLSTGQLIYERPLNLNVEMGGDVGMKYLIIGLIGFAKDDFMKHYIRSRD